MCEDVQLSDVFRVLSGEKLRPAPCLLLSPVNLPVLDVTWLPPISLQPLSVIDRNKPEGAGNGGETSALKSQGGKKQRKWMENGRREDLMRKKKKIIELRAFVFPLFCSLLFREDSSVLPPKLLPSSGLDMLMQSPQTQSPSVWPKLDRLP